MNFLGAQMSVLRLAHGTGVLIHAPLGTAEDDAVDFSLDVPWPLQAPAGVAGQPDVLIEPASHTATVHITRRQQDLWADYTSRMAYFRDRMQGRFEFLLLDAHDLAHLRGIMRQRWVRGRGADAPEITIVPRAGFLLDLGIAALDLRAHMPRPLPGDAGYIFDTGVGEITITPAGPARAEIELKKRSHLLQPPHTRSVAELHAGGERWLRIVGAEEYGSLPVTVCDADRDWMYDKAYAGQDPITGRHRCQPLVAREANKYVLLSLFAEGVVFDEQGICNEDGYLEGYGYRGAKPMTSPPPGMRCDHKRLFIDREALEVAPVVEGPAIVFILGNLSNYTHWLIDGLLALHVLLDFTPPGARILLPGTLRTLQKAERRVVDHYDSLRAFGFSDLPSIEIAEPYCRLEDAYWLEGGSIFNMPGEYIRTLRARVAALRAPPARRDARIYIARHHIRRIANADILAPFLERQGFTTHYLGDYSVDQQIDLFSQAEWVIGPHGAELGNLLFCQPGTKVLELAPDYDYKPYFTYMCTKLSLTHGVLPCATTDGTFHGDILVNMHKFTALFRMLKNRI